MVPLNRVDCFADAAAADLATFCLGQEMVDEAAESDDDDDDRVFQPQVERDVIHVAAAAADRHESTVVVVASVADAFAAAVDVCSFLVVLDEKM